MFPYHDENKTQTTPLLTIALIAANVLTWIFIQGAGSFLPLVTSVCNLGLIAGELTERLPPGSGFPLGEGLVCEIDPGRQTSHLLTSMFLHGSWMHLLGNMWFLWLFGNNIEDSMGKARFLLFYIISGISAALFQVFTDPVAAVPMVGASGAISGVMGAYLILYPHVRVFTLLPLGFFITTVALPAWTMLLYWMALQVFGGLGAIGRSGGVAFWAHIGGFIAGVVLIKLFAQSDRVSAHRVHSWQPRRVGWREW